MTTVIVMFIKYWTKSGKDLNAYIIVKRSYNTMILVVAFESHLKIAKHNL